MLEHYDLMSNGVDVAGLLSGSARFTHNIRKPVHTVPDLRHGVSGMAVVGALHSGMAAESELSTKAFNQQVVRQQR